MPSTIGSGFHGVRVAFDLTPVFVAFGQDLKSGGGVVVSEFVNVAQKDQWPDSAVADNEKVDGNVPS
jgi:hypothetical protein